VQAQKFSEICRIIVADPAVDLFIIQGQLPMTEAEPYPLDPFRDVLAATDKPVIAYGRTAQNVTEAGRAFQREAGIPFIQGLPETIRAAQHLIRYAEALRRPPPQPVAPLARSGRVEAEALENLLAAAGVPPPRSARAATPEDAAAAAAKIGFPVAAKILSAQPLHKTELGGVALGLADAEAVRAACAAMADRLGARIDGFLVQEMVDGLELIVGVREDAQFGPVMVAGVGGVLVEILDDVAVRLLPVDEAQAEEMLLSLKSAALLGPFRGRPARDRAAAARAMAALSRIFLDQRHALADVEINPLTVLAAGEGVRAVDLRSIAR
jgi:acyl-CoA synthetase (NDP forming)